MVVGEDQVKNISFSCRFLNMLLEEEFFSKIKKTFGLPFFRTCVLALLDIMAMLSGIPQDLLIYIGIFLRIYERKVKIS